MTNVDNFWFQFAVRAAQLRRLPTQGTHIFDGTWLERVQPGVGRKS